MENENRYASKGQAALNTVLGSIGTAGATGILGNLFNGGCNCNGNDPMVSRYELSQANRIAELETEVKLRDSNIYTDSKILDLYKTFDARCNGIEAQICQQNVYNATNTAAISCINGQIAQLMGLTKLVIPNPSVCPGWGNVTVTPATTTTAAGA